MSSMTRRASVERPVAGGDPATEDPRQARAGTASCPAGAAPAGPRHPTRTAPCGTAPAPAISAMICSLAAPRVVDGQADVHVDVREHLGQVAGLALERIGVQQQHRAAASVARRKPVSSAGSARCRSRSVSPKPVWTWSGRPVRDALPEHEAEQHRVGQADGAARLDRRAASAGCVRDLGRRTAASGRSPARRGRR